MNPTDFNEQWNSMQKLFLPTSEVSTAFRDSARRFWENQDKFLNSTQALANAWFNRRHAGTQAAREAAERFCGTGTFVDLVQEYQTWANGAFERLMADGLSYQQQIMEVTGALASPPLAPSASEKEVGPAQSAIKAPARSKTT